jgi:hypothetical protein
MKPSAVYFMLNFHTACNERKLLAAQVLVARLHVKGKQVVFVV